MKDVTIAEIEAALIKKLNGAAMTLRESLIADEYEVQEIDSMEELLNAIFASLPDDEDGSEADAEVLEDQNIYRVKDAEDDLPSFPTAPATGIHTILEQRGSRYGDFNDHAKLAQNLKNQLAKVGFYKKDKFKSIHKEAVDMILHKLARIVNGDPDYDDSWVDIAGYATLVADHIKKSKE
jgi:hypothetical protein